jgi:hypothetical protein
VLVAVARPACTNAADRVSSLAVLGALGWMLVSLATLAASAGAYAYSDQAPSLAERCARSMHLLASLKRSSLA